MKSQPMHYDGASTWTKCEPAQATHLRLNFPGPVGELTLPVINSPAGQHAGWVWNFNAEAPTLTPSVLTTSEHQGMRCHSYVTDGKVQFLSDCSHEFKGQTVELLELDER